MQERYANTIVSRTSDVNSGQVLLIIGGGLLAAGLVIAGLYGFAFSQQVLKDSILIEATSIGPGLSYVAVLKDLPAERQLSLSIDSEPSDVPLTAVITQSDGTAIGIYNITGTPFTTTLITTIPGDHSLELKNAGTQSVTVNGVLLNAQVSGQGGGLSEDDPAVQALLTYGAGILAGVVLIIAGIVIIIIGAVKHFRSRKAPESVPTG